MSLGLALTDVCRSLVFVTKFGLAAESASVHVGVLVSVGAFVPVMVNVYEIVSSGLASPPTPARTRSRTLSIVPFSGVEVKPIEEVVVLHALAVESIVTPSGVPSMIPLSMSSTSLPGKLTVLGPTFGFR